MWAFEIVSMLGLTHGAACNFSGFHGHQLPTFFAEIVELLKVGWYWTFDMAPGRYHFIFQSPLDEMFALLFHPTKQRNATVATTRASFDLMFMGVYTYAQQHGSEKVGPRIEHRSDPSSSVFICD